ncbi:unnamed protein product [Prunus brigantina]
MDLSKSYDQKTTLKYGETTIRDFNAHFNDKGLNGSSELGDRGANAEQMLFSQICFILLDDWFVHA